MSLYDNTPDLPPEDDGETGAYCVVATHRARPGQAEVLEARFAEMAARTRGEPGVAEFEVCRLRADRDVFVHYEAWESRAHLQAHLDVPYVQAWLAERETYVVSVSIQWLRRVGCGLA